jgi:hypothetical protein
MITLTGSNLYYENGVKLGEILCEVDGYYVFYPELNGGYWSEHILRAIADLLGTMNAEWDAIVQADPCIGGSST